jgi:hypothetical protein
MLVDRAVTNDRFVLVLVEDSAGFDVTAVRGLCEKHHAVHTEERVEKPGEELRVWKEVARWRATF